MRTHFICLSLFLSVSHWNESNAENCIITEHGDGGQTAKESNGYDNGQEWHGGATKKIITIELNGLWHISATVIAIAIAI